MSTTLSPPERSEQQRMSALALANEIRSKRAVLKKQLKYGEVDPLEFLFGVPEWAETMKVIDFVLALPKRGRVKTNRLLTKARISPSKTLGGLSYRQLDELRLGLVR